MKKIICLLILILFCWAENPVLKNNGFPDRASFLVKDYINKDVGFVTATIEVNTVTVGGKKYFHVESFEGQYFRNSVTLNYADFTTVEEVRYDIKGFASYVIESFTRGDGNKINFFHKDKKINLNSTSGENVYSRYAFMQSLSGFPFEKKDKVVMNVYMFEYGNSLPLRAVYQGKEKIKVLAGEFLCYKLELAVDSVFGLFAPDKYYLYYTVAAPHHFVRFDQKVEDGIWLSNELIKANY